MHDPDAWRVINLSRAGAGVADVLGRQLPELVALSKDTPVAFVSCIVGAQDSGSPGLETALRQMLAGLPRGSVVGTVSRGGSAGRDSRLDAVVREESTRLGLRVAELPADRSGRGGRDTGRLGDVAHSAWARAVLTALDAPAEEMASRTDPRGMPVVTDGAAPTPAPVAAGPAPAATAPVSAAAPAAGTAVATPPSGLPAAPTATAPTATAADDAGDADTGDAGHDGADGPPTA